tara:strand:- start:3025 stop:3279 length:255 start_codon:yes stop_codon:yes gene_type:complete
MFLIRIGKSQVVDAEKIAFVGVVHDRVVLGFPGEEDVLYIEDTYLDEVLNHLSAFDNGILNLREIFCSLRGAPGNPSKETRTGD